MSLRRAPQGRSVPDPWRRERRIVIVTAVLLVVWRSAVLVLWKQAAFDSDQAVMGLMAKHLSEGRAFPLFMYGQSYILAVEAWMAAPLFLVFGVSVWALKLPLLVINVAVAVVAIDLLEREAGLRPALAGTAALIFIVPAPGTAAHLLEASGGNLEPFLYVLLLWMTRQRPGLCGLIFGIGFLQREFTIYGLAALLCIGLMDRTLVSRDGLRWSGRLLRSAAEVWLVVQWLRLFSSAAGPGTTIADLSGPQNNILELIARTCVAPASLWHGMAGLFTEHWPQLFGTAVYRVSDFSIEGRGWQGLRWASSLPAIAVGLAVVRIPFQDLDINRRLATSICGYLILVGVFSTLGAVVGRCGTIGFYTMRYELLSLLGVVGLGGWYLRAEPLNWLRNLWIGSVLCWTLVAAIPHAQLWTEYVTHPPVGAKGMILQMLDARHVKYGTADYWLAYHLTFLSNERVIFASDDFVRIRSYNTLVSQHGEDAVRLSRTRCEGGVLLIPGVYQCR